MPNFVFISKRRGIPKLPPFERRVPRKYLSTTVEWHGDGLSEEVQKSMDTVLDNYRQAAIRIAKSLAPVRTGRLQRSIREGAQGDNRASWGSYGVPYAIFQELGTVFILPKLFLTTGHDQAWADIAIPGLRKVMKDV